MRSTNTIAVARLRWVALGAAELLAAHGEYDMATRIGVTPWLAWLFPVGIGVYAYCAFATGSRTDVRAALGLMTACHALAHLLAVDVLPRHWTLVVTVSAVAPIICWRVHHLGEHAPTTADAELDIVETIPVEASPTPAASTIAPPRQPFRCLSLHRTDPRGLPCDPVASAPLGPDPGGTLAAPR